MSGPSPPDAASDFSARSPGLVLVSTPIGNLGDLSARAAAALRAADLVLAEDTRVTAGLMRHLGLHRPMQALHDHNEDAAIPRVLAMLSAGGMVALVSDAGTPVVADPGYRLVRAAIAAGAPVSAIPGPNAAIMALTLSGLPPAPFLFLGFLPPKAGARQRVFSQVLAAETAGFGATIVLFEAPHRLAAMLAEAARALGDRPAAVARELTKRFEEVRRGTLAALAEHYAASAARGEITVVIGAGMPVVGEDWRELLVQALTDHSLRAAVDHVVAATGAPRRVVYAAALRQAGGSDNVEETGDGDR